MFSIVIILDINSGYAQDFKVLKIGDTIPEAFYIEVEKLGSAGKMFSESKGKLSILDFWSTYCGTCLKSFPKMQAIQDQFEDEIQVFAVNTFEDSSAIQKRLSLPNMQKYVIGIPNIANAKVFQSLFPHRVVPHHVWIDENGIVKLIGSPLNTNSEKIKSMLLGEDVFSLKGANNSISVNRETRLHETEGILLDPEQDYQFIITGHNSVYSPDNSKSFVGIYDTIQNKIRDTYINHDVLELYKEVFLKDIMLNRNKMVYSGVSASNSEYWKEFFELSVQDTLKLSSSYIPWLVRTDQEFVRSRYCYEQLVPIAFSEAERRSYMLKNLNQYFGETLGIKSSIIQKPVLCYILTSKGGNHIEDSTDGITPVNGALSRLVSKLFSEKTEASLKFMIDETGIENIEGLDLPNIDGAYSLEDIEVALREFEIQIKMEFRTFNFVQIKDIF